MGWLDGWDKRRIKFTVDKDKIDTADLEWFRVIVTLSPTHGDCVFDELTSDANRFKIAFTKADGETQLYGEIEKWDDANESAIIHVSRDGWVISNTENTDFYMYYDIDHADNTTYIGDIPVIKTLYLPEVYASGNPAGASKVITAVDCTGLTKANGYLKIDLKCDNPAIMSTNGQLELTSHGVPDTNEWSMTDLTGLGITASYQTFYIPLSDWDTVGGELNVAAINFIRWYNFSTNGSIAIYWKNAYIIIGSIAGYKVWNGDLKAVHHMVDATTSTIIDSTSNNNNGTKKGAGEPASVTGKVGLGQDFDGSNDYIRLPDPLNGLPDLSTVYTVEVLFNRTGNLAEAYGTLVCMEGMGLYNRLDLNATKVSWYFYDGVNRYVGETAYDANTWYYVVGVRNGNDFSFYVNGAFIATLTGDGSYPAVTNPYYVGSRLTGGVSSFFFNGLIDETHISSVVRTAGWIKAEYNNLWDTLIAYGSEETGGTILEFSETLSIADTVATSGTLAKAETLSIVDTKVTSGSLGFTETLSIVDSWSGLLTFFETLSIADSKLLTGTLNLTETLEIVDSATFQCIKTFYETLSIIDSKVTSGSLNLAETLSIVDSWTVLITFFESLSITDTVAMGGSLNVSEIISIIDSFIRWIEHPIYTEEIKSDVSWTKEVKPTTNWDKETKVEVGWTKETKPTTDWIEEDKKDISWEEETKKIKLD